MPLFRLIPAAPGMTINGHEDAWPAERCWQGCDQNPSVLSVSLGRPKDVGKDRMAEIVSLKRKLLATLIDAPVLISKPRQRGGCGKITNAGRRPQGRGATCPGCGTEQAGAANVQAVQAADFIPSRAMATPALLTIPPATIWSGSVGSNRPPPMATSSLIGRQRMSATHDPQTVQSISFRIPKQFNHQGLFGGARFTLPHTNEIKRFQTNHCSWSIRRLRRLTQTHTMGP